MHKASKSATASILSKMPLMNLLLKALSAFDPTVRVTFILNELLKLHEFVANVLLAKEEKEEYEQQPTYQAVIHSKIELMNGG